jgi:hypothetical protein
VMYHRRAFDQFLGFSMSSGEKSSRPSSLSHGSSDASMSRDLYGFAVGRESKRSIRSMFGSDVVGRVWRGKSRGQRQVGVKHSCSLKELNNLFQAAPQ